MYKTSKVSPTELKKIKVKNQAKIKEVTGEELDPSKAWTIIKTESKNFTSDNEKAKEADALLAELMKVNGLTITSNAQADDQERIRIRERERARAIQIMKLQLQIAA